MMKEIRQNAILFLTLLTGFCFPSCIEDDTPAEPLAIDWATIVREGSDDGNTSILFQSDSWGTLLPERNFAFQNLDANQRLVLAFYPVEDDELGRERIVRVEDCKRVLTKGVEELTDENDEWFGNDPVYIYQGDIWLGGGHLNIIFKQYLPVSKKHLVSLVARSLERDAEGYYHLEFRYNGYNDMTLNTQFGAVSYSLHSLGIDSSAKGIKLKLNSGVNGQREIVLDFDRKTPESGRLSRLASSESMVK